MPKKKTAASEHKLEAMVGTFGNCVLFRVTKQDASITSKNNGNEINVFNDGKVVLLSSNLPEINLSRRNGSIDSINVYLRGEFKTKDNYVAILHAEDEGEAAIIALMIRKAINKFNGVDQVKTY